MSNLIYNPSTYTLITDGQTVHVDTIFHALVRRETFDTDTIEHTIARFYAALRYVPLYVYTAAGYQLLTHFIYNDTQSSIIAPETFHQALIAFLTAAGHTITIQAQLQQSAQQPTDS